MGKRIIMAVLFFAAALGSQAQKSFFEDALKNGRQPGKPYVMRNPGKKFLDPDKVAEYVQSKGYIVDDVRLEGYNRFGRSVPTVTELTFLPKEELRPFAYEALGRGDATPLSQLTKKGTVYYFFNREQSGDYFAHSPVGNDHSKYFNRCDDALWSGELADGLINGSGVGFADMQDGLFLWFKGTFDHGVPVGEAEFRWIATEREGVISNSDQQCSQSVKVARMSDGAASFQVGDLYGFVSSNGQTIARPEFNGVKSEFANGLACVTVLGSIDVMIDKQGHCVALSDKFDYTLDDLGRLYLMYADIKKPVEDGVLKKAAKEDCPFEELVRIEKQYDLKPQIDQLKLASYRRYAKQLQSVIDKTAAAAAEKRLDKSGEAVAKNFKEMFGEKYKYDPDGMLAKIDKLNDYYTVCGATEIGKLGDYWWYDDGKPYLRPTGKWQVTTLSNAIQICDRDDNSPFKNYYVSVKPLLSSKYAEISEVVNRANSQYNEAVGYYIQGRHKRLDEYGNVIDADNVSVPDYEDDYPDRGKWVDYDKSIERKHIKFSTGRKTVIYRRWDSNDRCFYYWSYWSELTLSTQYYKSEKAAAEADYVFFKHEIIRTIGHK